MLPILVGICLATVPPVTHLGDAGEGVLTRYDYRQTFKYPFFTKIPKIPYFNKTGDVFIADNLVRLSPAMDYKKGSLWAAKPNPHKEWMVEFSFSVFGRNALGGDGFALFYTKEIGDYSSSQPDFYGRSSTFQGVALVFDSSDAPNNRFNPFIYAIENNGAKTAANFLNYASPSVHLGACFREYRNAPSPIFGKLIYKDNTLTFDIDIRQGGKAYTNCFSAPINLPTGYHFGLSASSSSANAGLDDHDIFSFEVYELNPPPKEKVFRPREEEDIAKGKEFKMNEKLEEKIKTFEKKVQDRSEDSKPDGASTFNVNLRAYLKVQSIVKLEENQFHILEALNVIEGKIGALPTDIKPSSDFQPGLEGRLTDEMRSLKSDLAVMRQDLKTLHETTVQLKQTSENLLRGLETKLHSTGQMLQSSTESSSALGTAVKMFAVLAGIALLIVAYTMRGGSKREKKFV